MVTKHIDRIMRERTKTVVLMLSRVFPRKHISAGKETRFKEKLYQGSKIHTIRGNYEMWKHNVEKITEGRFFLSLRQWSGMPYRSKQVEIKETKNVGYERISMSYDPEKGTVKAVINGKPFADVRKLAENDGLKWNEFVDWFFGQGTGRTLFQGVIIHFTDFRYQPETVRMTKSPSSNIQ